MRERDVEAHLLAAVRSRGGITRKVQWIGRDAAPDRVVFLPGGVVLWVECKSPTARPFPHNAHERAQYREHERLRALGQQVYVVNSTEAIDDLLP